MSKIRVGVLRGGPSNEYEISLKTGSAVLKNLSEEKYQTSDIVISSEGIWYKNGIPITPHHVISHLDVIFNALHGSYGEDGKVQHILEMHRIPFTGSGSFSSAIGMNKVFTKEVFKREGIKTPESRTVKKSDKIGNNDLVLLFRTFSPPFVVKPVSSGSSQGISLVNNFSSFELALHRAFEFSDDILMEEYIKGIESSVGVIDGYRDHEIYVLPPVEIRLKEKSFFDYDAKYNGLSEEIVPGNFSQEQKVELGDLARKVHKALGLCHYSRTDFIVTPRRGIFVLETNTLPGLTPESLFPKALNAVGSSLSHFIDHCIGLAIHGKR